MESRELTADDVVADLLYLRSTPGGARWHEFAEPEGISATDRYTVVIEFTNFSTNLNYFVGFEDRARIAPPETEGTKLWAQQVGTGPFMFEEYVVGSHMSYVKNPDYWDTVTLDGVVYQRPFIDRLVIPIMPDPATIVSALRTGTLDFAQVGIGIENWESLEASNPELESAKYSYSIRTLSMDFAAPPFDNVNVRRALMIGTDLKAFRSAFGLETVPIHNYPMLPTDKARYIPLEDLPADIAILFDYNPTLAKQMLADEGYPDGLSIILNTGTVAGLADEASLLKDQWSEIGIEAEIVADELQGKLQIEKSYTDVSWGGGMDCAAPIISLLDYGQTGAYHNWSDWSDERYDELCPLIAAELDPDVFNELCKEASLIALYDVSHLPVFATPSGHFWWPWIKNYYGEVTLTDGEIGSMMGYVWIDQDLKDSMGY